MAGIGFGGGKNNEKKERKKKEAPAVTNPHASLLKALTPRERKYIKERAKGKTKKRAALAAGYPESMANVAFREIEKPNVLEAFAALMDKYVPDDLIGQRLLEGTNATVVKTATFDGKITDAVEFVDFEQRRKYIELAAEFKGRVRRHGDNNANFNGPVMFTVRHIAANGRNSISAETE